MFIGGFPPSSHLARLYNLDLIRLERHEMIEIEGVVEPLQQALTKREYTELTPVQKAVTDPDVGEADLLVSAQTGSGKTVAFGLTMAPTILGDNDRFTRAGTPLALIVAPTRELALQIQRELVWLYEMTGAIIASCVGGMDMRTERRALDRGAHIVVGTPGRLRDHITRNSLNIADLKVVVLDEADEMLDLGFREDLEFILGETPEERRTLLFSATVPRAISKLATQYQREAVRISTKQEEHQHVDIEYRAMTVAQNERENAIVNVLRFYEPPNALIFCATRAMVNHITARFNNRGFSVVALSGELSQNERTHALQAMRDGRARVCIATDVAARGIDLPNLELVIHADLPTNAETLMHRSGRTGRAGRKGVSVLIVPPSKRRSAERLLNQAKIKAQWGKPPSAEEVTERDDERLLDHLYLTTPVEKPERAHIQELLARHGADQVAAAFLRAMREGKSAPEELQNAPPAPEPRKRREEFGESVWLSLSVGRKQNAEPRWLLPVLCGAGNITKSDIGAIKVQTDETFVQINAARIDGFMSAVGPAKTLEKNIRVTQLGNPPNVASEVGRAPPSGKPPSASKKPYNKGGGDKLGFRGKPGGPAKFKAEGKPKFAKPAGAPGGAKPKKRKPKPVKD
jgi:ATP-dependent RNA helicase DeaD